MPPKDLGVIAFVLACYSVLSMVADWGIAYALQKLIPETPHLRSRIAWTALVVRLCFSSLLGAVCWLLDLSAHAFRGFGGYVALLLVSSAFGTIVFVHYAGYKFRAGTLLNSSLSLCWIVLGLALFAFGLRVTGPLWGLAFAFAILGGIGFLMDRSLRQEFGFDLTIALRLVRFGTWATMASALATFSSQIGVLAVTYLRGEGDTAVFRVAATLAMLPALLGSIVAQPFLPVAARSLQNGRDEAATLVRLLTRYLLLIGFPMLTGGLILARPLVQTFFSATYLNGVWALRVLLAANCLTMLFTALSAIPFMGSGVRDLTRMNAVVAGVGLLVSLVVVLPWGITGAAIAQLFSSLISLLLVWRWLRHTINIPTEWSRWLIYALSAIEMALAVTILVNLVHTPTLQLIFGVLVGGLTYSGALFIHKGFTLQEFRRLTSRSGVVTRRVAAES